MKFSIGHRLFLSVLQAILTVAAGAVFLLRQNVLAGFGDYAVGIELDRLDALSGSLAARYRAANALRGSRTSGVGSDPGLAAIWSCGCRFGYSVP